MSRFAYAGEVTVKIVCRRQDAAAVLQLTAGVIMCKLADNLR